MAAAAGQTMQVAVAVDTVFSRLILHLLQEHRMSLEQSVVAVRQVTVELAQGRQHLVEPVL
jgi:hypothetical protein